MAWKKCSYCSKRISDKVDVCPWCKRKLKQKNIKNKSASLIRWVCIFLYFCFLFFLGILLIRFSKGLLYSENISDLFILLGISLVIVVSTVLMGVRLFFKIKKDIITIIISVFTLVVFIFGVIYLGKCINAYRYDNSRETLKLCEKFSIKGSKKLKTSIENIFEYDFDNVSSRNVIIANFYEDEENYVLYLDDYYGNYRLKFYVEMKNDKIIDIYWLYDNNTKLFFVIDGEKTANFEYYYAMYIVYSLIGEEVSGLARLDVDIEEKVQSKIDLSANTIFTYNKLRYDSLDNEFYLECDVESMDYYSDIESAYFKVKFSKKKVKEKNKVWYYGDSSFEYVNWVVKI